MLTRRDLFRAAAAPLAAGPVAFVAGAPGRARAVEGVVETPSALERSAGKKGSPWKDILPGPGLKGWSRLPIPVDGPLHKDVAVWVVDPRTSVLSCFGHKPEDAQPKPGSHEFFRYDREVADFVFHVEWRFVDPERKGWNSGVFARNSADGVVWHQAQTPGAGGKAFFFGNTPGPDGKPARQRHEARADRTRPPGEWNVYEITAKGDRLSLWVNGATVCEWPDLRVRKGYVGVEAEYHHAEFRNLKLRAL
jgi:hypothetical protein